MLGAKPEDTSVICAYKQGYSWIVEEMLPVMKEAQADQVEIIQRRRARDELADRQR